MNNTVTSYVRTYAPIVAGTIIAWLTSNGIETDENFSTNLTLALSLAFSMLYYLVARLVGKKYPVVERFMLGSSKTPVYREK
jgi:hypothetical protein